jgi:hypothetical protein
MTEREAQTKIDLDVLARFEVWWENEADEIIEETFGDEVPYNQIYKICKTSWMNGAVVRGMM